MSDPVVLLSTGDVVGPAGGVTDNSMVLFDGTSGKKVKGNNAVVTAQGLALLDDVDAAANRATIGLNLVNNTSDLAKPISIPQQTALDFKADTALFTGAVSYFARATAPTGWLKANGAAISRTAYGALFAAIGTTFGAGDGSTTFNLPDLRGEFLRGVDDARGVDSGRAFGSWQDSDNRSHAHTASSGEYGHAHTWGGTTSNSGAHTHTQTHYWTSSDSNGTNPRSASNASNANAIATSWAGDHTHTVSGTTSWDSHTHTVYVNAAGGTEARPRNLALLTCIKY